MPRPGVSIFPFLFQESQDPKEIFLSLKIESFSLFLETKDEEYEGGAFEAGGYKCFVILASQFAQQLPSCSEPLSLWIKTF